MLVCDRKKEKVLRSVKRQKKEKKNERKIHFVTVKNLNSNVFFFFFIFCKFEKREKGNRLIQKSSFNVICN